MRSAIARNLYTSGILLLVILLSVTLSSQDIPPKPNPPRLVNDFAEIISPNDEAAIERKLVAYDDSTSIQITVITITSLDGADDFDYAIRLAEAWGIGRADVDNGVLLFIALEDRKVRILTGYGAEGFLTDAVSRRIIEQVIVPSFRDKEYAKGIDEATTIIMSLGAGEYDALESDMPWWVPILIFALFVGLFFLLAYLARKNPPNGGNGGGYYRAGRYNDPWRGSGGGGWFNTGGSGGGGGGFGGGGFGGFGGGSFGGGGAGGSW